MKEAMNFMSLESVYACFKLIDEFQSLRIILYVAQAVLDRKAEFMCPILACRVWVFAIDLVSPMRLLSWRRSQEEVRRGRMGGLCVCCKETALLVESLGKRQREFLKKASANGPSSLSSIDAGVGKKKRAKP